MLSQTAEYALRAAVLLARAPDQFVPAAVLAKAAGVPPPYLAKLLGALARAGLVEARRGPGGGARLAFAPESLSALDVVEAVEPVARIRHCPLGREEHGTRLCALHRRIDEAIEATQAALASTTLETLVDRPKERGACRFPAATTAKASGARRA